MIAKPVISPDFTIEDIHKIREYHYELTTIADFQHGGWIVDTDYDNYKQLKG